LIKNRILTAKDAKDAKEDSGASPAHWIAPEICSFVRCFSLASFASLALNKK